ncbi:carbon storage regulator CsrA [Sanguibacter sp. A247]|uniref:carbon storage regulator CsrA n=1 Tax=unclassified Sanguibacter TaxID=2645534 RepID=UPI003FD85EFC
MLVLSRKVGESVLIGDDIVVTVVEARGDAVRIGIDAPRSMRVHRSEVVAAVSEANAAAGAAEATEDDVRDLLGRLRRPE